MGSDLACADFVEWSQQPSGPQARQARIKPSATLKGAKDSRTQMYQSFMTKGNWKALTKPGPIGFMNIVSLEIEP
jgi:hypothetical protein